MRYFVDAEFDDQSTVGRFGPFDTREAAEKTLQNLALRTDIKKATLVAEA